MVQNFLTVAKRSFGLATTDKTRAATLITTPARIEIVGVPVLDDETALFQLCAQFHQLERIVQDSWDLEDPEFWGNLLEEQTVLSTKICNMRPTTLMGYRAVARALVGWLPSMQNDEIADLNGRDANLLAFLLQHLVEDDP